MKPEALPRSLLPLAAGAVLLLVLAATLHLALGGSPPPATPEARAHAIGERLACPICAGESVADSPSALAEQMRGVIRDQIAAGRSDDQIVAYFVARYGQGILRSPPQQGWWSLAWLAPLALLLLGAAGVGLAALAWSRRPPDDALPALSEEEERAYAARLERLTAGDEPPPAHLPGEATDGSPDVAMAQTAAPASVPGRGDTCVALVAEAPAHDVAAHPSDLPSAAAPPGVSRAPVSPHAAFRPAPGKVGD